jgi:hypothetical protein
VEPTITIDDATMRFSASMSGSDTLLGGTE